jgi:hypothetical protein
VIECLSDPTIEQVRFLMNNLRDEDVREISASRASEDREDWTVLNFYRPGWKTLFLKDGEPIALLVFHSEVPRIWYAFLVATPRIIEIRKFLIKHIRKIMLPALFEDMNARLLFTHSIAWREHSKHWLQFWGGVKENTLKGFGKGGEDVDVFCLRKEPS